MKISFLRIWNPLTVISRIQDISFLSAALHSVCFDQIHMMRLKWYYKTNNLFELKNQCIFFTGCFLGWHDLNLFDLHQPEENLKLLLCCKCCCFGWNFFETFHDGHWSTFITLVGVLDLELRSATKTGSRRCNICTTTMLW